MPTIALPLLADRHNHPMLYTALRKGIDLTEAKTVDDVRDAFRRHRDQPGSDGPILAYGWLSSQGDLPQEFMEKLPPTGIFHRSWHRVQVNRGAREMLRATVGDAVDSIENRDWYEQHLEPTLSWFGVSNVTPQDLTAFFESLRQQGFGYAEEMLLCNTRELDLFHEAGLTDRTRFWCPPDLYRSLSATQCSRLTGFKLFTDGAIGSFTAAMQKPYVGRDPETRGLLLYTEESFAREITELSKAEIGLAIHAIGDAAIDQIVRVLNGMPAETRKFREIRIEHAQLISHATAKDAKRLGIKLCMQPNFSVDSIDYSERLGTNRAAANNPFRMLIDDVGYVPGEDLLFGTDGMPQGVQFALQYALFPPHDVQRLDIEEFKKGFGGVPVPSGRFQCKITEPSGA
jgi:predicted amidohydrolase YtcJ